MSTYDIIVVGGGIVGTTTALLLAKKTNLRIALLERQHPTIIPAKAGIHSATHRVSSISLASVALFQELNLWNIIKPTTTPFSKIHVWDASGNGKISFDSHTISSPALGYIVEDNLIRNCLFEKLTKESTIDFFPNTTLTGFTKTSDHIELQTESKTFQAQLIIAADGSHSKIREQAGIEIKECDYHQTAIVATVTTELPHQYTAWQRFLPTGPLAFLPLQDAHTVSIVWSYQSDKADAMLSLDDENFCSALGVAFENRLGRILSASKRLHFPLALRHASRYAEDRLALVGDAAHTIHPLAGQGVNLGLEDAEVLTDVLAEAYGKNRSYATLATLRRYERTQKSHNFIFLTLVDLLKNLFATDANTIHKVRNWGLNCTDKLSFLKKYFMRYASFANKAYRRDLHEELE